MATLVENMLVLGRLGQLGVHPSQGVLLTKCLTWSLRLDGKFLWLDLLAWHALPYGLSNLLLLHGEILTTVLDSLVSAKQVSGGGRY